MAELGDHIVLGRIPNSTSNWEVSKVLEQSFPVSFRKAQDVLVAIKKMKSGGGWFSSSNQRIRKAQEEVYTLERALRSEDFFDLPANIDAVGRTQGELTPQEAIFLFMNYFAQAFPNWRPEYEEMNRFVPQLY